MNSLLYYYNNVQKMAAYRQAKRMQRGVKLGYGENPGLSTSTSFFSNTPIPIGTSDFSIEYYGNAYGTGNGSSKMLFNKAGISASSSSYFQVYGLNLGTNTLNWVAFGIPEGGDITTDSLLFYYSAPTLDEKFHLVITRAGKTIRVYIDNVIVASKEQTEIKDMGEFVLGVANSSDVGFVRVWNYALSADEIATLDNNGDPMGYVVPKAKRDSLLAEYLPQNLMESRKGPEVEPTAETYEFNIGSPYSQTVVSGRQYPFDCIYRVDYVVDEWDFQPMVFRLIGFVGTSGASVIAGVNSWTRESDAKIGEVQSCFIKMPNEGNPSILLYGDQDTEETTARHLKVTIKGITPVSVPISWLNSAKQLPLSDEYMEPLFQSIGGYDMTANGAPEIIYNE